MSYGRRTRSTKLEDVLDQFGSSSEKHLHAPPPTSTFPPTAIAGRPRHNTQVDVVPKSPPDSFRSKTEPFSEMDGDGLSDSFARELATGMERLMRELVDQPGNKESAEGSSEGGKEMTEEEKKAFKAAWEAILVEGLGDPSSLPGERLNKDRTNEGTGTFQDKIKQTINKLKENESIYQVYFRYSSTATTDFTPSLLGSNGFSSDY